MTHPKIRLLINMFGSVLARGANVIATAITIPLTLHALGSDNYAVYATMASFSIFFAFSDLGIGLSVVNPVAEATTPHAADKARLAISQAWAVQLIIGLAVGLGGAIVAALLQSIAFDHPVGSPVNTSWVAMLVSVGFGIATGLGQRVMFALGKNLEANIWLIAGRALSVLATYAAARAHAGLFVFILAAQAIPTCVSILMMGDLFLFRRRDLAPRLADFQWDEAIRQLATGLLFLVLSFAVFCEMGVDNIILSLTTSAEAVTHYDVTSKPFFYICSLSGIILFPIWPYITQETAAGRAPSHTLINKAFLLLGVAITLLAGIIFLNIKWILLHWVATDATLGNTTTLFMAINTVFISLGMLQSMILNAKGKIREQAIIQGIFIACLLPLKLLMSHLTGPLGIVLTLTCLYVPRLIYVQSVLIKKALRAEA